MQSIKTPLFYSNFDDNLNIGDIVFLDKNETNHIYNSLRKKQNDIIAVFNGRGILVEGSIIDISKNSTKVIINNIEKYKKEKFISAIIPLFNLNKLDFSIEKLAELGIHKIYIYNPDFNNKNVKHIEEKLRRWQRVCIAACKQSYNIFLPELYFLNDLCELEEFDGHFIVPFELEKNITLEKVISEVKDKDIFFIIGSEGGFSQKEIDILQRHLSVYFVKLTDTILRVETAVIYTASVLTFFFNK